MCGTEDPYWTGLFTQLSGSRADLTGGSGNSRGFGDEGTDFGTNGAVVAKFAKLLFGLVENVVGKQGTNLLVEIEYERIPAHGGGEAVPALRGAGGQVFLPW